MHEHSKILSVKNSFLFNFVDRYIQNGMIRYIKNKAEMPKNITLLRQTNPLILPKFNISVL